jgi:hypothetical protein
LRPGLTTGLPFSRMVSEGATTRLLAAKLAEHEVEIGR